MTTTVPAHHASPVGARATSALTVTRRDTLRAFLEVALLGVRHRPHLMLGALVETVSFVVAALMPVSLTLLVDGLVSHNETQAWWGVGVFGSSIALSNFLVFVGLEARMRLRSLVGHLLSQRISALTASLRTVEYTHDPQLLDKADALLRQPTMLAVLFSQLCVLGNNTVYGLITLVSAWIIEPRLLLLLLPAAASMWFSVRADATRNQAIDVSSEAGRAVRDQLDTSLTAPGVAEARVLGAAPALLGRLRSTAWQHRVPLLRAEYRAGAWGVLDALVTGTAFAALIWWLVTGGLTAGQAAGAIMMLSALQTVVYQVQWGATMLRQSHNRVERWAWLKAYAARDAALSADVEASTPAAGEVAPVVELRGASYQYLGAESDAVREVSLQVGAGEVVALVGENGAGKTTLVQLMLGLFPPTRGEVWAEGTPLGGGCAAWRQRCAGTLQEYTRLEMPVRDAVGCGDVPAGVQAHPQWDDARITQAVDAAHASDLVDGLPKGLGTQLGESWQDGTGLSGGQWQRLAVARGLMRETPALLVLDEPTSALDPDAEHALMGRYREASAQQRASGGATVLVTHRLSSVMLADRIVVLHRGRVEDTGTHAELMARGGRYAELFTLQAAGYLCDEAPSS